MRYILANKGYQVNVESDVEWIPYDVERKFGKENQLPSITSYDSEIEKAHRKSHRSAWLFQIQI